MRHKVRFDAGNPSAYTQAKYKMCPSTDSPLKCIERVQPEAGVPQVRELQSIIFLSCKSLRRQRLQLSHTLHEDKDAIEGWYASYGRTAEHLSFVAFEDSISWNSFTTMLVMPFLSLFLFFKKMWKCRIDTTVSYFEHIFVSGNDKEKRKTTYLISFKFTFEINSFTFSDIPQSPTSWRNTVKANPKRYRLGYGTFVEVS